MSDDDDILKDDPETDFAAEDEAAERAAFAAAGPATAAPQRPGTLPPGPEQAGEPGVLTEGRVVWRVKVLYSSATEFCESPAGLQPAVGDTVVISTRYGNELGKVLGRETEGPGSGGEMRTIVRIASHADLARVEENDLKQERAFEVCREKIEHHGLDMKLVSAHYLLDEQKILFFFTAESRVDFRELVKDLVAVFKIRIELRQIGVRDEARVVGGVGICGRALCCNAITDKLRPVSIKMAKEQNLTLNSMKISGPCGRLLCCLSYEFDVYREARQTLPSMGTRVQYEGEEFRVTEMNVLARRVRFQSESGRVLDMGFDSMSRNPETQVWELKSRESGAPPSS
jgi:cell fate regulator YaaT (PSP1 superfamily)